ncbi:hypothetical protein [Novosphingobium sp. PY1]|uniref:Uncharacterized protein n=1 Tax=Ochrobactrum sp. PW1 TaxID=1882222 RepID=A0A292GSD9_9HYPH|nr:hypothetical protein [Novosphingobium sp. PY1]BBA74419.1 hypothetical protein [Ochrobactrum sp. PW1]GFM29268.1 uncharacterized protein PY1_contig-07-194 [Novosphingobium sp. PY1]
MQQRQDNPLNRSRHPERRQQVAPNPVAIASTGDIANLQDAVTTLNIAVTALQASVADFETRISALEDQFTSLGDYADDTAAASGGVTVGGLYRNGSALMIRVA